MGRCPKCGGAVTPLKMYAHRSACDGKKPLYMQSRPGRVKSLSMRTSGMELRRSEAIEAHHVLESNVNANLKKLRLKFNKQNKPPIPEK